MDSEKAIISHTVLESEKFDQYSVTESDKDFNKDLHSVPITLFPEGKQVKQLYASHSMWGRDIHLEDDIGQPQFFAAMHEYTGKPDLILYHGSTDEGEVAGGAYFRVSRHLKLVVGPEGSSKEQVRNGDSVVEMKNTSKMRHERYIIDLPVTDEAGSDRTRRLEWKRLHGKDGIKGLARWTMLNYKLVDTETGDVLAVLLTNGRLSCRQCGKVVVRSDLGQDLEALAIMGALGLAEKWRRRMAYGASGAGSSAASA